MECDCGKPINIGDSITVNKETGQYIKCKHTNSNSSSN